MKRHPHLQPLSREHHLGLNIANKAKACTDTPDAIAQHWQALTEYLTTQIPQHFVIEDTLIADKLLQQTDLPLQQRQIVEQMQREHHKLAQLSTIANPSQKDVVLLANMLYEHIRFEERQLFAIAQEYLDEQTLQAIYHACSDNSK